MSDQFVRVAVDGLGKKIDVDELTIGANTVERQRVVSYAAKAASAVVTSVASSETSVTLKASNAARLGLAIQNDSSSTLYVKLGATASSTDYTVKLFSQSYYEIPFNYTGIVDGIWVTADGNALVTELAA